MELWACYKYNQAFSEPVTSRDNLVPMYFAGHSQNIVIDYLLKQEMAKEIRREYYNNKDSLRIEISTPFALGTRLEVYVITPLHIVNGKTLEVNP